MLFVYGFVVGATLWVPFTILSLYAYGAAKKWPAFKEKLLSDQRLEFDRGKREGLACAFHAMGFVLVPDLSTDDQLAFRKLANDLAADEDDEWETKH